MIYNFLYDILHNNIEKYTPIYNSVDPQNSISVESQNSINIDQLPNINVEQNYNDNNIYYEIKKFNYKKFIIISFIFIIISYLLIRYKINAIDFLGIIYGILSFEILCMIYLYMIYNPSLFINDVRDSSFFIGQSITIKNIISKLIHFLIIYNIMYYKFNTTTNLIIF